MWRVKSKTGQIVHLTEDRKKTLCNYTIKDSWKFLTLLKGRIEATEMVEGLCPRCNEINLDLIGKELEEEKEKETNGRKNYAEKTTGLGTW